MNKWVGMGRLTRDPDVRYSTGEKSIAIARYTIAVNRRGKRDEADFIQCVAFDRAGEFAEKYFHQGMRVLVSGRIQTGSYTNKNGDKVYTTEIVVEEQEFADSKSESGTSEARKKDIKAAKEGKAKEDFMDVAADVEDEGLPFN